MPLKVSPAIISELTVSGPSSEDEIRDAERKLDVIFPAEYREFLAIYGAALGPGYEIAGLTHEDPEEPPLWDNVVMATRSLRDSSGRIGSYDGLVVISHDGLSVTYYLRTEGDSAGKVLALGPGVEKEVANSFSEFIARVHAGALG